MNLLFTNSEYPDPYKGGIENITYNLAKELTKSHNIFYISKYYPEKKIIDNHSFIVADDLQNPKAIDWIKLNNIDIIINQSHHSSINNLLKLIKQELPNIKLIKVIHSDPLAAYKNIIDSETLFKSSIFHKVWRHLNFINILRGRKRLNYLRQTYNEYVTLYDKIVTLSPSSIPEITKLLDSYDKAKFTVIPNFYNCNYIPQEKKDKVIIYVGRLEPEAKRPDRLVMIWNKLHKKFPDWKLLVVGEGSLKHKLIEWCKKKGITNIEFIGRVNPLPYYLKASILCLTSTCEGFGLVLIESQSMGVIPICFNSFPAAQDIINNKRTGILVKPFSISQYAKELGILMSNYDLRHYIQTNIIENNKKCLFSSANVVCKWENLFTELTGQ